jgi:hypothetical protein
MRTTIAIDDLVLRRVKTISKNEKKSLARTVSELLMAGIKTTECKPEKPKKFHWNTQAMNAKIDISDKEQLYSVLDQPK